MPHFISLMRYTEKGLREIKGSTERARLSAERVEKLGGRSTDFQVTVPTTMVWSTRDIAITREGVDGTERWVSAPYELVVLEGVSHWIPTQAPEELAAAVLARIAG